MKSFALLFVSALLPFQTAVAQQGEQDIVRVLSDQNGLFQMQVCKATVDSLGPCRILGSGAYRWSELDALYNSQLSKARWKAAGSVLLIGGVAATTLVSGAAMAWGTAVVIEAIIGTVAAKAVPGVLLMTVWAVGPTTLATGTAYVTGLLPFENFRNAKKLENLRSQISSMQITISPSELEDLLSMLTPVAPAADLPSPQLIKP